MTGDLADLKQVTVSSSAGLEALGITILTNIKYLALIPAGTLYFALADAASASTAPMPTGGIAFPIKYGNARLLQFYASSVGMTVMQFA